MMARVKAVKAKNNTIIVYARTRTRARKKGREEGGPLLSRSLPLNRLTLDYGGGAFHDFLLRLTYLRSSFFFL